jgi:hypothetical protein
LTGSPGGRKPLTKLKQIINLSSLVSVTVPVIGAM